MELELFLWIGRRLWSRPWVGVAWALLMASSMLVPLLSSWSIRTQPIYSQIITYESVFLWSLLGGLLGLGALAQLGARVDSLTCGRRWRVRGFTILATLWLPALPIWGFGAFFSTERAHDLIPIALLLVQLSSLALAVDSLFSGQLRSIAFAALAWWVPALVPELPFGPGPLLDLVGTGRALTRLFNEASPDSAVWQASIGSMLALVLGAIALDLIRRPTS